MTYFIGQQFPPSAAVAARPAYALNLVGGASDAHAALTWYVARAATRQEARAEESLTNAQMAFYVPRFTAIVGSGRKRRSVKRPLFDGYLFAGLARGQSFYDLARLEAIHGVIRFGEVQPRPADFGKISRILAGELEGDFDRDRQATERLKPGEVVRVIDGTFAGFDASIVRLTSKERVRVLVSLFGRLTETELDADAVMKLA